MAADRPRFIETHGGRIVDMTTGHERLTVNVDSMTTSDARAMVATVLDALNRAYGRHAAPEKK